MAFLELQLREYLPFNIFTLNKKKSKSKTYSPNAITSNIISNKIEIIINCCGSYTNDYDLDYSANVRVTLDVLRVVAESRFKLRVILFGSAAEYGVKSKNPIDEDMICSPKSIYGITKYTQYLLSKYYRQKFDMDIVYLRLFNIHGNTAPDKLVTGKLLKYIRDGETDLKFGSLSAQRDYLSTQEFVESVRVFCEAKKNWFFI